MRVPDSTLHNEPLGIGERRREWELRHRPLRVGCLLSHRGRCAGTMPPR
jgi:hypothetical protein